MNVQIILIPLLQTKLPQYLEEKWELDIEDIDEKDVTIDRFFKFLNKQVISKEARERSFHEQASSSSSAESSSYHVHGYKRKGDKIRPSLGKRNRPIVSSASALMEGVKQTHDSLCVFCNKKGHETSHCANAKDKSSDDRWKIVKDKKTLF